MHSLPRYSKVAADWANQVVLCLGWLSQPQLVGPAHIIPESVHFVYGTGWVPRYTVVGMNGCEAADTRVAVVLFGVSYLAYKRSISHIPPFCSFG